MLTNNPLVTVGIISYNNATYLKKTVDSIINQSLPELEIIIADDGSSDGSIDIIEEYCKQYPNIKLYTHPEKQNKGVSATCNLAIKNANGEFIMLTGSDDIYYPEAIAQQAQLLSNNPKVGMVYGKAEFIDKDDKKLNIQFGRDLANDETTIKTLIARCQISAPTVMMRKQCYQEVGLYNENLTYNDWELWLRILLTSNWQIAFQDKFIAQYRIHDKSISGSLKERKAAELAIETLKQIEKYTTQGQYKELINKVIGDSFLDLFYFNMKQRCYFQASNNLFNYILREIKFISFKKIIKLPRKIISFSTKLNGRIKKAGWN